MRLPKLATHANSRDIILLATNLTKSVEMKCPNIYRREDIRGYEGIEEEEKKDEVYT